MESQQRTYLVLVGGPAMAGKSTLAVEWCVSRPLAVHIELDAVRSLIVSGSVDPQEPGEIQTRQYGESVDACCALARSFLQAGYDVAIDDVLEPDAFRRYWTPSLIGLDPRIVILLPRLDAVLSRARTRQKQVPNI